MRLGVLTDCQGPLRGSGRRALGRRDAPSRGGRPPARHWAGRRCHRRDGGGPQGATRAAGAPSPASTTSSSSEARRLVEKEHVDAIVGGDGVVIRDVARLYPDRPVRLDVLGRARDHAPATSRKPLPLHDRLPPRRPRGSAPTPTTASAGAARASSRETATRAGRMRPRSLPSSVHSAARSSTASTARRCCRSGTVPPTLLLSGRTASPCFSHPTTIPGRRSASSLRASRVLHTSCCSLLH